MIGTVRQFDIAKGYGFVLPDDANTASVFVHLNIVRRCGLDSLRVGDRVEVEVERNPKDGTRLRATSIALAPAMKG